MKIFVKILFIGLFFIGFVLLNQAQMSRKPSGAQKQFNSYAAGKSVSAKRFLPAVKNRAEFDAMARIYHKGTPYALPHALFIIDRKDKNRIFYINSQKFRFHQDFANAVYLTLERGEEFFKSVYINDKRRLIVGTIAFQPTVKKFTYEFWEGDLIQPELIKLTDEVIAKTFFDKVYFKPNAIRQEEFAAKLGLATVTQDELNKNQEYLALNTGKTVGRIHVIDKLDDTVEIGYNEILVLNELPLDLPPVAGIIVAKNASPLSHVNLLAKGWNVPNVYIKNAAELFKKYDTYWVELDARMTDYTIKPADKKIIDVWQKQEVERGKVFKAPPSNLNVAKLASLSELRRNDSIVYGSKAANLGEITHARIPQIIVPKGFGVPFAAYDAFIKANGFDEMIADFEFDNDFVHNPRIRRQKLEDFRRKIQSGKFDEKLKAEILKKWHTELGGQAVFVRSSSNSEDLPNFSGAGLYTSVPNVKDDEKVIEAVKTVWASLWNFAAYEARERNFIEHKGVYMGAFIQVGVNMDNGGVLITKDPFDAQNKGAVYISATRGHNIQVVENKKIPEQILFSPKSNSVQVLTRSNQDTIISFDENGGLKEEPFSLERRILNDETARNLVKAAQRIKLVFGGSEQDIEWGYQKGQIFILQARPYIEKKK